MYILIINPLAGYGKAKKIHQQLMKNTDIKDLKIVSYFTQYKGHAENPCPKYRKISIQ